MGVEDLLGEARKAMASAYAPYSSFTVGAALLAEDGTVWTGCNVENASFGLTVCAERVAVFGAVAGGRRAFVSLALVSTAEKAVPPCGACLQVLSEFAPELHVISQGRGQPVEWSLDDLLPERFGPSSGWRSRSDKKAT